MPTRRNFLALWLLPLALIASRASADEEYIFSAPPREIGESESDVYLPIADYLSKATGKKIVYQGSNNWLSYQDKMREGAYDLVFDGPHFVSWRMARLQHVPLVKLAGDLTFVVIVRKDNDRISRYSKDKDLVPATNAEFRDLQILLKDTWGFELERGKSSR